MGNEISRSHRYRYGDRAMKVAGGEMDGDRAPVHLQYMAQFHLALLIASNLPMLLGDHTTARVMCECQGRSSNPWLHSALHKRLLT